MSKPDLPTVYTLVALDEVDSTNAEARRLALTGETEAPDGTLVWAKSQTAGRGRMGRTWESPEGNFCASLILRPEVPLARAAELNFVASLSVFDALGGFCEAGAIVSTKWPNDVLIAGRKIAGVLLEAEGGDAETPADFLILGVGVNLASAPGETAFPATCLREEGVEVTPQAFLESFARHFLTNVTLWLEHGFERIRRNWLWRADGKGETIEVRLPGETLEGVFEDLDETGALILGMDGEVRVITAGDVFFKKSAPRASNGAGS